MPRVSIRRLSVYAVYTLVGASLVMLANIALQQQNYLWLRVIEQQQQQQAPLVNIAQVGDQSKEIDDADTYTVDLSPPSVGDDESSSLLANASVVNILRRHGLPWYIKNDGYRPAVGQAVGNVWPDRLKMDRIEEQLMIPPRIDVNEEVGGEAIASNSAKSAPLKKVFLPSGLNSWQVKGGQSVFLDQKCPVDRYVYSSYDHVFKGKRFFTYFN